MSPQRPIFDFSARTYFVISQFEMSCYIIRITRQTFYTLSFMINLQTILWLRSNDEMLRIIFFGSVCLESSQQQCGQAILLSIIIWLGWGMINCNPGGILGTLLFEVSRFAKNGWSSTLMFTWIIPTPMCLGW